MPAVHWDKLPPDHPFAGTRIVHVDALMKKRILEQRAKCGPMAEAVETAEEFLRTRQPVANDKEPPA